MTSRLSVVRIGVLALLAGALLAGWATGFRSVAAA